MELDKYIGSQIRKIRKNHNISAQELAERLNTTSTSINRYERGARKANQDTLFAMAQIFNVSINDFFPKTTNVGDKQLNPVAVPLLSKIENTKNIKSKKNVEKYLYYYLDTNPGTELFAIVLNDNSMEPTVTKGSINIIQETTDVKDDEIVAVLFKDSEIPTLRRIRRSNGTTFLVADNSQYPPIVLTGDDSPKILGKAIKSISNL